MIDCLPPTLIHFPLYFHFYDAFLCLLYHLIYYTITFNILYHKQMLKRSKLSKLYSFTQQTFIECLISGKDSSNFWGQANRQIRLLFSDRRDKKNKQKHNIGYCHWTQWSKTNESVNKAQPLDNSEESPLIFIKWKGIKTIIIDTCKIVKIRILYNSIHKRELYHLGFRSTAYNIPR